MRGSAEEGGVRGGGEGERGASLAPGGSRERTRRGSSTVRGPGQMLPTPCSCARPRPRGGAGECCARTRARACVRSRMRAPVRTFVCVSACVRALVLCGKYQRRPIFFYSFLGSDGAFVLGCVFWWTGRKWKKESRGGKGHRSSPPALFARRQGECGLVSRRRRKDRRTDGHKDRRDDSSRKDRRTEGWEDGRMEVWKDGSRSVSTLHFHVPEIRQPKRSEYRKNLL